MPNYSIASFSRTRKSARPTSQLAFFAACLAYGAGQSHGSKGVKRQVHKALDQHEVDVAHGYTEGYVCGCHHPQLESEVSHAWFEVGEFIVDITYDQFQGTGLSGWLFKQGAGWHAQFPSQKRRDGFCSPSQWLAYPYDGYKAALEEAKKAGLSRKADSGKSAMAENTVERAAAVTDLADHLENDLLPCPAGRAALLSWLETQLAQLGRKPVPTTADATWLIESAYIQWAANEPKS